MTSSRVADVLARTSNVLLDFDGPVCSVFSGFKPAAVVAELQARLGLVGVPPTAGMFDTLRYVARNRPDDTVKAEAELADLEMRAMQTARPTPHADAAIRQFHEQGVPVVIVSNNSARCVQAYLDDHGLTQLVAGVSSRTESDPRLLKPHPHLLLGAVRMLGAPNAGSCLMIGDSVTDVEAAKAAGASSLAYANKPGKRERFADFAPDAIIDSMVELLDVGANAIAN